jgi:hypothetical protein
MWYIKLMPNGTDINKWYLDPMQAYPKDRVGLKKVHLLPSGKKKSECTFKAGKKTIADLDSKQIDVDGDIEAK